MRRTAASVLAEMRPADLPESTSDTVDCETPAALATSTLVTRGSPGLMRGSLPAGI